MTDSKRGTILYARVLYELGQQPRTNKAIEPVLRLDRNATKALMAQMHLRELVHVGSWEKDHLGRHFPVWHAGRGEDATKPARVTGKPAKPRPKAKIQNRPNLMAFESVVRAMEAQPHTRKMLAQESGLHSTVINRLVTYMHGKGLIRVADWDRDLARVPVEMFIMADGQKDKPRPRPQSLAELNRKKHNALKARREMLSVIRALANVPATA